MISPVTFRYLLLCQKLMWWGGGTPFTLVHPRSTTAGYLKPQVAARGRRVYHMLSIAVNVIYVCFVSYRLISKIKEKKRTKEVSFGFIIEVSYVLTCYTVSVLLNIQTMLNGDSIPYFIMEYVKFFKRIEGKSALLFLYLLISNYQNIIYMFIWYWTLYYNAAKYIRSDGKLVKCNIFLTVLFTIGNLVYLQNFLLMSMKPHRAHFFTSLLSDSQRKCLFLKLPYMFLQAWVWYNLWTNIYFYIFTVYIYICCGIYLLRELK